MTRGTECGDEQIVWMNRTGSRIYVLQYWMCSLER